MAKVTISEALSCMKTLKERHSELVALRNENSNTRTRHYGMGGDKTDKIEPVYDVKKLDALVGQVAKEIRKLDVAIKNANATLEVPTYDWDEKVLGEIA
jgi:hypothetical protein